MNKLATFVFAASAVVSGSALAQQTTQAKPSPGYLQDTRSVPTKDAFGLCWRTGTWTPADATAECDPELVKPVAVAPAPVPPAPAPAPAPVSEKVTFAADTFFDFDRATLKPDGRAKLDELTSKLQGMDVEVVVAVGHTDNIGNPSYNQKLSLNRAESVKGYLASKGIEPSRVFTEGRGEKQPIADNKTEAGRAKNRRVEIEVVGTRTK